MNTKEYAKQLENKLIAQFKKQFYDKMGYEPIIITQVKTKSSHSEIIPLMSLETLQGYFDPFLPLFFGKTVPLSSKLRIREIVELRNIYCHLAKQMNFSLKTIGVSIGNRDHTTVIHNLNAFSSLIETNDTFRERFQIILKHIKSNHEPSTMDDSYQIQYESQPALFS